MAPISQQRGPWDSPRGNSGDNTGTGSWPEYLYDLDHYISWGYITTMYFFLWAKSAHSMYDSIIVMDPHSKPSICKGWIPKALFKHFGTSK